MKTLILLALAASTALALPKNATPTKAIVDGAAPTSAAPAVATGSIAGVVTFEGALPKPIAPFQVKEAEIKGCKHMDGKGIDTSDHTLLIDKDSKCVANVVFFLKIEGQKPVVPEKPIEFDQHGCRFTQHVLTIPAGATLEYNNSDDTNHNIHTYSKKNDQINKNVAAGDKMPQVLDRNETFEVKCDIHPWMKAYIVVSDASMTAVSAADGTFSFDKVPAGKYKLSWWHEKLGKGKTAEIEVTAGHATPLAVKVKKGKSKGGRHRRR